MSRIHIVSPSINHIGQGLNFEYESHQAFTQIRYKETRCAAMTAMISAKSLKVGQLVGGQFWEIFRNQHVAQTLQLHRRSWFVQWKWPNRQVREGDGSCTKHDSDDLPTASSPNKTVSQALQCRTDVFVVLHGWLPPTYQASIYSPEVKLMVCKIIRNTESMFQLWFIMKDINMILIHLNLSFHGVSTVKLLMISGILHTKLSSERVTPIVWNRSPGLSRCEVRREA